MFFQSFDQQTVHHHVDVLFHQLSFGRVALAAKMVDDLDIDFLQRRVFGTAVSLRGPQPDPYRFMHLFQLNVAQFLQRPRRQWRWPFVARPTLSTLSSTSHDLHQRPARHACIGGLALDEDGPQTRQEFQSNGFFEQQGFVEDVFQQHALVLH